MEERINEQTPLSEEALAEVDRRVQEAVSAARIQWEQEQQAARQEESRRAMMTDEERAAYDLSRRAAELDERERILIERELRAMALTELTRRGLPTELADALPYDSEARCKAALDRIEQVFRAAVQASVEERLKGETPASGAKGIVDADSLTDAEYYRMTAPRI